MSRRPERAVTRPGEPARMPAVGRVCGQEAGPASCTADVLARGLCRSHYRRLARGGTLDPDEPAIGSPAGHGRWGIIDPDPVDPGRLICHICGRSYVALGVHIGMVHDDGVRAYRLAHGLPMSASLAAPQLAARLAEAAQDAVDRLVDVRRSDHLADVPQDIIARGRRLTRRTPD
ncbi:MAG: hypothetical protein QG597_959 [Actinomycetota bacterium]|nr:hypothetical protein [Actinomycetota bacterium]